MYLSIPKDSSVKKTETESSKQLMITKDEASTEDLLKDIFVYYRLGDMDKP